MEDWERQGGTGEQSWRRVQDGQEEVGKPIWAKCTGHPVLRTESEEILSIHCIVHHPSHCIYKSPCDLTSFSVDNLTNRTKPCPPSSCPYGLLNIGSQTRQVHHPAKASSSWTSPYLRLVGRAYQYQPEHVHLQVLPSAIIQSITSGTHYRHISLEGYCWNHPTLNRYRSERMDLNRLLTPRACRSLELGSDLFD